MSRAKKCDRCGAYYDKNYIHTKGRIKNGKLDTIRTFDNYDACDETFDLCNNCWVDFEEFMNKKGE